MSKSRIPWWAASPGAGWALAGIGFILFALGGVFGLGAARATFYAYMAASAFFTVFGGTWAMLHQSDRK